MLYKMKLGDFSHTIPTIGFNVEQVKYKNLMMTLWDVGGQDKIRALWKHYYEGTDALIWIVDSTDEHRLRECRDELHHVLANDGLRGAAVLVYANKQDCANAASTGKLAESLGLRSLSRANEWLIQPASALTGDGVYEGLEWLTQALKRARSAAAAGRSARAG